MSTPIIENYAYRHPLALPDALPIYRVAAGAVADAYSKAVAAGGAAWGSKTGLACSDVMVGWLMGDAEARAAMLGELLGCFLTGKGDLRADFAGDKGRMTDCVDSAARIVGAVRDLLGTAAAMRVADELAAAWALGRRFAEAYALAKREAGLADFDDLITLAGTLPRVSRVRDGTSDVQGKRVSVRVDLRGRRVTNKTEKATV